MFVFTEGSISNAAVVGVVPEMSALGKQLAGRRYQSKYLLGAKILLPHRLAGTQLTAATPVDVLVFGKRCEYPGCGSAYRCGAVRRNGR